DEQCVALRRALADQDEIDVVAETALAEQAVKLAAALAPDVVLIDVEGYEAHVLDGAAATLASRATDFFVELHSDLDLDAVDSTAHEVMRHFDERHFDVRVALADDTPPGLGSDQLLSSWEVAQSGGFEASGRRCFVVATARPVNR
ncbi:MAG: hypothetical protein ACRDMZ_19390, partial [Solirubrobacteraceae bacterium]